MSPAKQLVSCSRLRTRYAMWAKMSEIAGEVDGVQDSIEETVLRPRRREEGVGRELQQWQHRADKG
jgi:hypothetical protein